MRVERIVSDDDAGSAGGREEANIGFFLLGLLVGTGFGILLAQFL